MPGFQRWRDALAVLAVIGLLVLAAPGARAVAAGFRAPAQGPSLLLLEIPVAAAAVAATLAVALFVRLRRRRADAEDDDGVPPPPKRNPWARFVALAIILVLVALPVTRQFIARQLRLQRPEPPAPAPSATPSPAAPSGPVRIPSRAGELVAVAVLGLLAVLLLALLARRSTGRRAGLPIRRPRRVSGAVLAEAAAVGATELSGDDPRTAVLRCYAAMARVLARAGVAGRASDVPRELLNRAAASGTVPAAPVRELTDLFGAARYSSHPVTEADRQAAATALRRIRDGAP